MKGSHNMDNKVKAFFWQAWEGDGCSFYRMKLPSQGLAQRGHVTHSNTIWLEKWQDCGVLVAQRVVEPGPTNVFVRQSKERFTVLEVDDDLTCVEPDNPGYKLFSNPATQACLRFAAESAHAITVSTPRLKKVMEQFSDNVHLCKNGIPSWYLDFPRVDQTKVEAIGWQGSPTHARDVETASEALRAVFKQNSKLTMDTTGTPYLKGLGGLERHTDWLAPEDLAGSLNFQIGIAPIKPNPFNASKSAVKVYEYWSRGIVPVATNYGPYREEIEHGVTGLLVKNPQEWKEALDRLIYDDEYRIQMSDNCYNKAKECTIENRLDAWESSFAKAFDSPLLHQA